jgi:hypothetical protein
MITNHQLRLLTIRGTELSLTETAQYEENFELVKERRLSVVLKSHLLRVHVARLRGPLNPYDIMSG